MAETALKDPLVEGNKSSRSGTPKQSPLNIKSDFLTAHAPEHKSARLSSAILDYKRPEGLNLVPLGSSWSVDLFARSHNGIRRELIDLYNMVDSMQRRIAEVRSGDLRTFFLWWDVFESYFDAALKANTQLLIPWACSKNAVPAAVNDSVQAGVLTHLDELKKGFRVVVEQIARRPPDESLAKIIKGLTHIHPIFEFIEAVENNLPEIAEANHSPKEGSQMEKKVVNFFYKTGNQEIRRYHIAVLARGMTEEVESAWSKRVPALVRFNSWMFKTRFNAEHIGVVSQLAHLE
jgi:hypothetical protein